MGEPNTDTIVAAATPLGRSALALVRISGPDAITTTDRLFLGRAKLARAATHTVHAGRFVSPEGEAIDQVVVALFRRPTSYTGEDVVEISSHGNPLLTARIVDLLRAEGLRPAEPGEFTRRALLNGKLDLAQAEAVAALIHARSEVAARCALQQLDGGLSAEIATTRRLLLGELAALEAHVDFPDEDLPVIEADRFRAAAQHASDGLRQLCARARRGRPFWQQAAVVLAGIPNVGKSSLFNALVGRERAIVHGEPGTTRDVVDAEIDLGGAPVRLVDTAGLAASRGDIEAEGMRRSRAEQAAGRLVLVVLDATRTSLDPAENQLLNSEDRGRTLVALNKVDLGVALRVPEPWADRVVRVSARTREGLDDLANAMERSLLHEGQDPADALVIGLRQEGSLERAAAAAEASLQLLTERPTAGELVAEEWRACLDALGEITGESTKSDLLDAIFSGFCIGK